MASHSDHQRIGQTVGARLRAARIAKKLTQGQLAQPDFSVSYVSAIERGQISPSLRALEIFAQRLGVSSADLLSKQTGQTLQDISGPEAANVPKQEIELVLLQAHLFILQENYHQAVTLLSALSTEILKPQQEIRQRYLLGIALYHSDLLQESESVLTEAFNKAMLQNDYFVKHIRDMLGSVHVAMRNHKLGFEYQQGNLVQLEKEQLPHDAFFDAQVYSNIALHYQELDRIDIAIEMFQHALDRTKGLLATKPQTAMYWNMATYLAEAQQYFPASLYGYKTLQLLLQEYNDAIRSEIYHYLGKALLYQDLHNAVNYLESLQQNGALEKDMLAFASISATIAEALLRLGEVKKAYKYAQKACKLASGYRDCVVAASIILTYGSVAYAQKDYQVGDTQFKEGLTMLERLNDREELADEYAIYAQLLEERGLQNEALEYYKRAYQSSLEYK